MSTNSNYSNLDSTAREQILQNIQNGLVASLADTLFMESVEIGLDDKFLDLGMNSIVALEWTQKIIRDTGLSVDAQSIYKYPTVAIFSKYLLEVLEEQNGLDSTNFSRVISSQHTDPVNTTGSTSIRKNIPVDIIKHKKNKLPSEEKSGVLEKVAGESQEQSELIKQQEELRESLCGLLGIEAHKVQMSSNLIDIGLTFCVAMDWVKIISEKYGLLIKAESIIYHQKFDEFSAYLASERGIEAHCSRASSNSVSNDRLKGIAEQIYKMGLKPEEIDQYLGMLGGMVKNGHS